MNENEVKETKRLMQDILNLPEANRNFVSGYIAGICAIRTDITSDDGADGESVKQ